ncbi:hypothetical protein P7K49_022447 [Saguinus oedipus]|uniref:Uncharacterized protein n=1 Tax=Saguinus oedipus TaxID=9490 RepID=A0ABQ9UVG2_SAGOE|nr:hypothetical protein P7K49_022447 [Saguinus oedipus]
MRQNKERKEGRNLKRSGEGGKEGRRRERRKGREKEKKRKKEEKPLQWKKRRGAGCGRGTQKPHEAPVSHPSAPSYAETTTESRHGNPARTTEATKAAAPTLGQDSSVCRHQMARWARCSRLRKGGWGGRPGSDCCRAGGPVQAIGLRPRGYQETGWPPFLAPDSFQSDTEDFINIPAPSLHGPFLAAWACATSRSSWGSRPSGLVHEAPFLDR